LVAGAHSGKVGARHVVRFTEIGIMNTSTQISRVGVPRITESLFTDSLVFDRFRPSTSARGEFYANFFCT
jgi:hypothetical protein